MFKLPIKFELRRCFFNAFWWFSFRNLNCSSTLGKLAALFSDADFWVTEEKTHGEDERRKEVRAEHKHDAFCNFQKIEWTWIKTQIWIEVCVRYISNWITLRKMFDKAKSYPSARASNQHQRSVWCRWPWETSCRCCCFSWFRFRRSSSILKFDSISAIPIQENKLWIKNTINFGTISNVWIWKHSTGVLVATEVDMVDKWIKRWAITVQD